MNKYTAVHLIATFGPATLKEIGSKAGLDNQGNMSSHACSMVAYKKKWCQFKKNKDGDRVYTVTKEGQRIATDNADKIETVEQLNAGEEKSAKKTGPTVNLSPVANAATDGIVALIEENKRLTGIIANIHAQSKAALEG